MYNPITGTFSLHTSEDRGGHARNNYSNVVYRAAPQEAAAVSGIEQMISQLDAATSALLQWAGASKQLSQNQTIICNIFGSNTPPHN